MGTTGVHVENSENQSRKQRTIGALANMISKKEKKIAKLEAELKKEKESLEKLKQELKAKL